MNKFLIAILLTVALVGCSKEENVRTVYKNVPVPVYVVPQPPVITRPVLATETLTVEQKTVPGEVLKAERASVIQLQGYIHQLELYYGLTGQLAKTSSGVLKQLELPEPRALELTEESKDNWVELIEDSGEKAKADPNE